MSSRTAIRWVVVGAVCVLAALFSLADSVENNGPPGFDSWLAALREDALARKISASTLDAALGGVKPVARVIELDHAQPEFKLSFAQYLDRVINDRRVLDGRRKLAQHSELLATLREKYDVQPRFIVALWGIETDFGRRTGSFAVIDSLVTLAHDGRRGAFFRGELLDALQILDEGHIEPDRMLGSWAGAMGQTQFMPSSFKRFAVDHNGDARRDIWTSTPDALASAANYLSESGWRGDLIWGREVRLPDDLDPALIGRGVRRKLQDWQAMGVRRRGGADLPEADENASIVQPDGREGPAYLVYENYRVLLKWNRSDYFATAVGLLSDRISGRRGG